MSSIVADELAKIKSFETETEKRRSELTLNELNYISDKQLHKKDGGGSGPVEWDFLANLGGSGETPELLIGDFQTFLDKCNDEESKVCIGVIAEIARGIFTFNVRLMSVTQNQIGFMITLTDSTEFDLTWYPDNTLVLEEEEGQS